MHLMIIETAVWHGYDWLIRQSTLRGAGARGQGGIMHRIYEMLDNGIVIHLKKGEDGAFHVDAEKDGQTLAKCSTEHQWAALNQAAIWKYQYAKQTN